MNAVEIEAAVSELFAQPFAQLPAPEGFALAFLEAFGNKATTLRRLQSGETNKTDLNAQRLPGLIHALLQTHNIHIATVASGHTGAALDALRQSPATARARAKFILATDGDWLQAEDLASGETLACAYADTPNHFGFFLALAGISTVRAIRESSFDIRATARLNKLYAQLLKDNPGWGGAQRRADMNHFMARLIFCFFAEDTDIFNGQGLFTRTVEQMSEAGKGSGEAGKGAGDAGKGAGDAGKTASDPGSVRHVIGEIFRAMNTPLHARAAAGLRPWADQFPYVNGGLFASAASASANAGSAGDDVPHFSRTARSYLLHVGALQWRQINPDIFGSMIQAVANEDERSQLGMHYTSVPNILKVLGPLFLDDLRNKLQEAAGNPRTLLNLRKRIARIRVFDPACGSGNFLVIAYKELRAIEAAINEQRGEQGRKSDIPLTNFRGIELRHFAAEIARLALIIAKYQCDVQYRGQQEAYAEFLPLEQDNWITCGNALRLDWLNACPPAGSGVKLNADDLSVTPLAQAEIDFANEGGETYLCGNPPYLGSKWQSAAQKADLQAVFGGRCTGFKSLDYVAGWFIKAADYMQHSAGAGQGCAAAFVATNSICQGQQVPILWPLIFGAGCHIHFAHTSFKWANLASHNAGVTVAIVGITRQPPALRRLYSLGDDGQTAMREVDNINAYLVPAANVEVEPRTQPWQELAAMQFGNHPYYGAALIFSMDEARRLMVQAPEAARYIRPLYGSQEFIHASPRACLWIEDSQAEHAMQLPAVAEKTAQVRKARLAASKDKSAQKLAQTPHRFREQVTAQRHVLVMPRVSSENRPYLPVGILEPHCVIQEKAFALYDAPLWNLALIASRLHWVWIATVCSRLEMRFSYSNTLGWNTFPVPPLGDEDKARLTACAQAILLAREAHFPATIAELYAEGAMPENLRHAHERNDETLERIYIGRRFKNDTERLEKLFALYTQMRGQPATGRSKTKAKAKRGTP